METVDDETSDAAIAFIRNLHEAGRPWFVWWNSTRMHFRTHLKKAHRGISGQDEYADGMVEHDMHSGTFLNLLDELKKGGVEAIGRSYKVHLDS
jgi:arylsulfatase